MPPILLLTRPRPQAERFAETARGTLPPHDVLIAPLSEVVRLPHDPAAFEGARGLILTSANAVPMIPPLPGLTAWCVGAATARAARQAGFTTREGGGDAEALIALLRAERPDGPLVHAHGRHLARDVVGALRDAGLDARGIAVYEARALDWPPEVGMALHGPQRVFAPLFSPRAAAAFADRMEGQQADALRLVAISQACADRLPARLKALCTVAAAPGADEMLRVLKELMSQSRPLA
ncbi:MAG: uroporphyrinogen-III synthase [Pararhodobacter sp.]